MYNFWLMSAHNSVPFINSDDAGFDVSTITRGNNTGFHNRSTTADPSSSPYHHHARQEKVVINKAVHFYDDDGEEHQMRQRLKKADDYANCGTNLARLRDVTIMPKAIELLTAAIKLNPSCHGYYGNRSLCFSLCGDYANALNDINLALQFEPNSLKYLNRKKILEQVDSNDPVNDPVIGVIISNVPRSVKLEAIRDLVCSRGIISPDQPIFFVENVIADDNGTVSVAIPQIPDLGKCHVLVKQLDNYPYGIHFLKAELLHLSLYKELRQLSTSAFQFGEEDESALSDDDDEGENNSENEAPPNLPAPPPCCLKSSPGNQKAEKNQQPVSAANSQPAVLTSKTVFIGNLPVETETIELRNLITSRVQSQLNSFEVAKKPAWDYAFVNCVSADDARLIHDALSKARFAGAILDVDFYYNYNNSKACNINKLGADDPLISPPNSVEMNTNNSATSVYAANLPTSMEFHQFFDEIYPKIREIVGTDFTVYRQAAWRHCFLKFPDSKTASAACNYLNGLEVGTSVLKSNLADKGAAFRATSQFANCKFSLGRPSAYIRVDNLDGSMTHSEIKDLFAEQRAYWRDYPTAYFQFANAEMAAMVTTRLQGRIIHNAALIIRYVNM